MLIHFLKLIRYKNLLIIAFAQLFTAAFLQSSCEFNHLFQPNIWLTIVSTLFIAAAGYLINDYSDVKIDVINKPDNIIIGKYISKRWALAIHLIFNAIGIGIAGYINPRFALLNLMLGYLLWKYSVYYKYQIGIGNIIVAGMMSLSIAVLFFASNDFLKPWMLCYAAFAFISGLIREVTKDIEDQEGDKLYGCRTIPIVFGMYRTKIILASLIILLAGLLTYMSAYLIYWKAQWILLAYLTLLVIIPIIIWSVMLKSAHTKSDFSKLSTMMKIIMISGIISMGLRCIP